MTRLAGATGRPVSESVPELLYYWSCWLVILGVSPVMGGDVVLLGPPPHKFDFTRVRQGVKDPQGEGLSANTRTC